MGIVVSGSSSGGLVFPVMLNKLIVSGGFAQATRAVAYLCTGLLLLAVLLMRTRLPPRSKAKASAVPSVPLPSIKDLLKDTKYVLTFCGYARFLCQFLVRLDLLTMPHSGFFNIISIFTPIFYLQLYAIKHGVDENLAFYTITILNGASIVRIPLPLHNLSCNPPPPPLSPLFQIGRIIPNFIGDVWGPFNTLLLCTIANAILTFCTLAATNAGGIVAICVLYGIFSGACTSPSLSGTPVPQLTNANLFSYRDIPYQSRVRQSIKSRIGNRVRMLAVVYPYPLLLSNPSPRSLLASRL